MKVSNRFIRQIDPITGHQSFFKIIKRNRAYQLVEIHIQSDVVKDNVLMEYPSLRELDYNIDKKLRDKSDMYSELTTADMLNPYQLQLGDTFQLQDETKEKGAIYRIVQSDKNLYEMVIVHSPSGYKKPIITSFRLAGLLTVTTGMIADGTIKPFSYKKF